jgi:alkanesulfonate monooxygenase SsuD/methylene tetrahydromethanopterin reductase-like flavin-dependent oxidoreductase (luciferase family)
MLISAKLAPTFSYEQLTRFWLDADELGFHSIWNYDHFYGLGAQTQDFRTPTLEGWTTLAAMAVLVKRARIGCMVTGVTYRHPAVLANMAVTIDHISGGRLDVGIGAAWHEPEHRGYGIEFPTPGTRVAMVEEAVTVMKHLWTDEAANVQGRFWSLTDAVCEPKPVQKPHPPVVIGATQPKLLRVTAALADEWNAVAFTPDSWIEQNMLLDKLCAEIGRDPSSLRRGVQLFMHPAQEGQMDQQMAQLSRFEEAGCDHVVLSFYQPPSRDQLASVAPK